MPWWRSSAGVVDQDVGSALGDLVARIQGGAADDLLGLIRDRTRQEMARRVDLARPLEHLKEKVSRRIWRVAQQWCDWGETGPILFPAGPSGGTRMYYRKGDTALLLYDQPPQVRSIIFSVYDSKSKSRYYLAFPYMVFGIEFVKGRFQNVFLFYLNEPLSDFDQRPLCPNLPNVDSNSLRVCMGDLEVSGALNVHDQTKVVLDHFWGSHFTGSLRDLHERSAAIDPRIGSLPEWQESSRENPMFPREIPWLKSGYRSFRHFSTRVFAHDAQAAAMERDLCDTLVDETTTELMALLVGCGTSEEDPAFAGTLRRELATEVAALLTK